MCLSTFLVKKTEIHQWGEFVQDPPLSQDMTPGYSYHYAMVLHTTTYSMKFWKI